MYLNSSYGGVATSDLAEMDLMITELEPLLFKHRVNVVRSVDTSTNRPTTMLFI